MPTYQAYDIANYFLFKENRQGQELLSNLKLQKLLYYAQGLHLATGNGPLFHEHIEAWMYGPVVPVIYRKYKEFGSGGIFPDESFNPATIDGDTTEFLDEVYDVFGQFSAIRLMDLSHQDKCWVNTPANHVITHAAMETGLRKYLRDGQEE